MLSISSAMRILLSPTGISDYPRAATSVRKHSTREDLPLHLTKQSHSCDVWRRPFPCPLPHSHASHVLDHTFYEFRLNHVSFHNLRQTQSPALVMTDLCLPAIFGTLFKDSIACCSLCCDVFSVRSTAHDSESIPMWPGSHPQTREPGIATLSARRTMQGHL